MNARIPPSGVPSQQVTAYTSEFSPSSNTTAALAVTYIALGSNQARPVAQLQRALAELEMLPDSRLLKHSPLYRTAPVGLVDQPDFINAVAELHTALAPEDLLRALQAIEHRHGRIRSLRWGPRTLDLDLLLYNNWRWESPILSLPHPRLQERRFVLQPLFDIAPDLSIPGLGRVTDLLSHCPPQAIEPLP